MEHIINYNKYSTDNPFEDNFLFENRGIPQTLKWLVDDIFNKLKNKTYHLFDVDESDLKLKNLHVKYHNKPIKEILARSRFGVFVPDMFRGKITSYTLNGASINVYFDFDNFDIKDLKSVILHELLHIYEIYKRYLNKTNKDLQWQVNNQLQKIRNKYTSDEFLKEFIFILYLNFDFEIGARVAETYSILIEERSNDYNKLKGILKSSTAWQYMNDLKEFDYNNFDINIKNSINFFSELNNKISPNKNFKIFKIPKNEEEVKNILKNYQKTFNKKSDLFKKKLLKIIDEVIIDVDKLNNENSYVKKRMRGIKL